MHFIEQWTTESYRTVTPEESAIIHSAVEYRRAGVVLTALFRCSAPRRIHMTDVHIHGIVHLETVKPGIEEVDTVQP